MQTAIERWQELQKARAQQMDAAYARLGKSSAGYWDRRARGFHQATKDSIASDPLFQRVQQEVTAKTTVLDVGAGTGRFALGLAPQVQRVIAVEPNSTMLSFLQRDAAQQGIHNIECVNMTWEEAPTDLRADVVICSHVLYPIWDVEAFVAKLYAATLHTCYIYMRAVHLDALTAHLWRHFHGDVRCLSPAYIHALDVLYDMGLYADVEIVHMPPSLRFHSIEQAVEELTEQLILPDDQETQAELRMMLAAWLVERGGRLVPPVDSLPCAIIKLRR
jgi:2-polyprenyl-3-methyl-5-hydroxy-6-metoxy-1,4-benzoquinol methylase